MSEENFWLSSSEQNAIRDKNRAKNNNYILLRASKVSEENFLVKLLQIKKTNFKDG